MMTHAFFITVSFAVSGAALLFLAVKSYTDMKKSETAASSLRKARRKKGGK